MNDPQPAKQVSYLPQWVNDAGSISSIVSLLLTAIVTYKLYAIAKHYRELFMVPKVQAKLSMQLKNLTKRSNAKDWDGFLREVAVAIATIESALPYVPNDLKALISDVIQNGRDAMEGGSLGFSHEHANDFILRLTVANTKLELQIVDKQWQKKT